MTPHGLAMQEHDPGFNSTDFLSLEISKEYLDREREYGVEEWIEDYAKRNKLKTYLAPRYYLKSGETYTVRVVLFETQNRLDWFVRRGNQRFPHFEFL